MPRDLLVAVVAEHQSFLLAASHVLLLVLLLANAESGSVHAL